MSKFVTDAQETIEFDDGEWVKIPVALSYEDAVKFSQGKNVADTNTKMLVEFIKEWNFKLPNGEVAEINEESIKKLDVLVVKPIAEAIASKIEISKKKSDN